MIKERGLYSSPLSTERLIMTLEEIFQRAKQIKPDITLPVIIDFVNDCMHESNMMVSYNEVETTYSSGTASVDLTGIFTNTVDVIEEITFDKNSETYYIPSKTHRGNSKYFYELRDRDLYIYERQENGSWDTPSEDLSLTIKAEVLPTKVTLSDIDSELPADTRLHPAILDYVKWHTYVLMAGGMRSIEQSQQFMYMSKYHEKRYFKKVGTARRGNIDKKMHIVKPPKTTAIR